MANSRPADGVAPEQLTEYFEANGFSSKAWELVRHRIVTDYAFKVGTQPGVVLFLQADSEDEAQTLVNSTPMAVGVRPSRRTGSLVSFLGGGCWPTHVGAEVTAQPKGQ